ncbi:hypothetical protein SDC9_70306 [bioreactor metagenome]|uniref:Uncharacterized protein n=1 Tax=bioreactor metagenome TaxID=1076179 RepID=A0A644Y694_9ZZZZ
MWKELMLSARSRSLFDWRLSLPELDIDIFRERYLDPAPGEVGQVLCPTKADCPETECSCRNIRDLSMGTVACCIHRFGIPPIKTTGQDLSCFSLSYARFHADLCKTLGLEYSGVDMDNRFFWELGVFKIGAAKRIPVYISYLQTLAHLDAKIRLLLASTPSTFAVVVFDMSLIRKSTVAALTEKKCICLSLKEVIRMNRDSSMLATDSSLPVFQTMKSSDFTGGIKTYTCSAGTKWSDICITHHDSETVYINRRGEPPVAFSYRSMGLVNSRKDTPSMAFMTLLKFLDSSDGSVKVPAKSSTEYDFIVQRKKELLACFEKVFPTIKDGSPIIYDRKTFCYRVTFLIKQPPVLIK